MAGITAELDPEVARSPEEIRNRPGGPVVLVSISPLFEPKYAPINDTSKTLRERAHLLIDAIFDADERVEQGHFFNISLHL